MKRPTRVECSTTTGDWPDKAIAILHEGFKVRLCDSSPYEHITSYTFDPADFSSIDSLSSVPYISIPIHFDQLVVTYEIPLFLYASGCRVGCDVELENMIEVAHEMNKKLAEKNPESIFVLRGSYEWERQLIFYPKWTKWVSISYWIQSLLRHKIKWSKMPGYFTRRGRVTVYVGVLPKTSGENPDRNASLASR